MKVAIFGGTGFVGRYLVDALLRAGHEVSLLIRAGSEIAHRQRAESVWRMTTGDIAQPASVAATMADCDAAVYCIGILREQPRLGVTFEKLQYEGVVNTVEAARKYGVRRMLLMSANGVRNLGTPYQETKWRADKHALQSGLPVTVFRPSVMFGDPLGAMEIATQLWQDIVRLPLPAPSFLTSGADGLRPVQMSPVHVADVADAFVAALQNDETIGQVYELGGSETLSWAEMIRRVARATGRNKNLIPMPIPLMMPVAALLDWIPQFPVTRAQLKMLAEDNVAGFEALANLISRTPRSFSSDELYYLT